jgi:hypothetical protein
METNSLLRKAIAKLPKTPHQGARLKMAHSLAALASKARSCADIIQANIIQANQGAIVAQGAAILE